MGWTYPSNNTGVLTRANSDMEFTAWGLGNHDIIIAEPFSGNAGMEIISQINEGNGRYRVVLRVHGHSLVRFHGESVN